MLDQPDLLKWRRKKYPRIPGFKRAGTSEAAAKAIAPRAPSLREQVLALLQKEALTIDQCAKRLNKPIWSIRPRGTELLALGKIYDTGDTKENDSGHMATVWAAVVPGRTFYAEHGG